MKVNIRSVHGENCDSTSGKKSIDFKDDLINRFPELSQKELNEAGSDSPDVAMAGRVKRAKQLGATEFVVPHMKYGHRNGVTVIHNSSRVTFSNLRWDSIPCFWFSIRDNISAVTMQNVNLKMKNSETELLASWRDGFHIKNSRFGTTIEDCDIDGAVMYDDAFAIYTRIHKLIGINGTTLDPDATIHFKSPSKCRFSPAR